jgi:hypothetical protein
MAGAEGDDLDGDRLVAHIAVAPVLDLDGTPVTLREYFKRGTTVAGFVRHFGCLFCHQMVSDLISAIPQIVARGGRIVIIGNGSINQARQFFRQKDLPCADVDVLTDPDRNAFQAANFDRGYGATFLNRGAHKAYARARGQGHKITGLFGDLVQLGGLLVVRPPANLVYLHRSRFAGDHPDMNEVFAALDRGGASGYRKSAG